MSTDDASLDLARKKITDLVERFRANYSAYKNPGYNETQTRVDFIDPFFEALGWDVNNRNGYAPAYRDVIHEDQIKIGGFTKAPDYCFRIGGVRKFFVEAKKPSIDMKGDPVPYYQLRRYAFSAKLPVSIVTDFEEFAVVDCRTKPSQAEKASTGRIRYWNFEEYLDRLPELIDTFSPEGIKRGGLDRLVTSARAKRGTGEVDKEFLKEIETWRELLARNIALRNPGLTQRDLNHAVQVTIDRIIFLRICEDRGIEEYGRLQGVQNGANAYARLCELFQRADERYNSGLFHFRQERGNHNHPDELTLGLAIDDKPLKQILKGLYYPDSPYEFSVLPIDILGQVYEQFLGKVIRLTAGHRAIVEDKPEVKKAGGVYYTPTYIVDYIVKNTVGKLLEGKTPKQAEKLRVLDPACGSSSFLIGAYEYLLDWHRDWYSENDPDKWAKGKEPRLFAGKNGWQLTTAEKKRILLGNIYGVDIDAQAVEVTKLSLLLKVLEEESQETINAQLKFFHERALPDLGNNIKCGNSLIGTDFFEGQQMGLLGEEEIQRINPFDWDGRDGFPEIMQAGGFDAVIGNPPYVRIQNLKEWAPVEVEYYKRRYMAASKGNYDIYVVFVERGLGLLNEKGLMGFILPHKFFNAKYGESLRELISSGRQLSRVVHFGHQQVFENASIYTCLMFLSRSERKQFEFMRVNNLISWQTSIEQVNLVPAERLSRREWNFVIGGHADLFNKLDDHPVKLGGIARIFQGLVTGADRVFVLKEVDCHEDEAEVKSADGKTWKIELGIFKPFLKDASLTSFGKPTPHHWLLFPYKLSGEQASLFSEKEMLEKFPKAWVYLKSNSSILRNRERGKWNNERWYAFGRTQNLVQMEDPKLIVQVISLTGKYAFDDAGIYFTGGGNGPYYGVRLNKNVDLSLQYVQGLLNSKLLDFYLHKISTTFRGGYWSYGKRFIEQLPIRSIDFADDKDKTHQDQMVELVDRMLELNKQLQSAKTAHDKTSLQRQIDATDRQIDRLVYELYDLTGDEVKIVEGKD